MPYHQGDIVIVPFPYTDQTDSKPRPAIIVSNSVVNNSRDVICVQLTTQDVAGDSICSISSINITTPFRPPHHTQNVVCKKVLVIEKSLIRKKISEVREPKLREILATIQSVFDYEN